MAMDDAEACESFVGVLKVDAAITPTEYLAVLDIFGGVYYLHDYQFFYRNLQDNVSERATAYLEQTAA